MQLGEWQDGSAPDPTTLYRFTVNDTYGDGWTNNQVSVEYEMAPGTWVSAGLFENASDPNVGIVGTNILAMTNGAGSYSIDMELRDGYNHRMIVNQSGSYPEECGYSIYVAGDITPFFTLAPGTGSNWVIGTIHTTFVA